MYQHIEMKIFKNNKVERKGGIVIDLYPSTHMAQSMDDGSLSYGQLIFFLAWEGLLLAFECGRVEIEGLMVQPLSIENKGENGGEWVYRE